MISLQFEIYCAQCYAALGKTNCLVSVKQDGSMKLDYPEELGIGKNSHIVNDYNSWHVLCVKCFPKRVSSRKFIETADLTDDRMFQEVVKLVIGMIGGDVRKLSSRLRVSVPTVKRWVNGVTAPHIGVRENARKALLQVYDER